jgi:peptide chain release factor 1
MKNLDLYLKRFDELSERLAQPASFTSPSDLQKAAIERAELEPLVERIREYRMVQRDLSDAEAYLAGTDPGMRALALEEVPGLRRRLEDLEKALRLLLLPKDPDSDRNAILEIRAGTGGEEAALFAGDLLRMYLKCAEKQGYRIEMLDSNPTELGGFKEVVLAVNGKGAYGRFRFESGTHRVQRVPRTEAQGRIHTSAATVAVLPEADEVEMKVDEKDLRIDTFCSSGAGGQSVNTTYSAIRITHLPTGIVVQCQDERSQLKNRAKAMKVLLARLRERAEEEARARTASDRKSQVGSGDRSEKIRTYNFPQNRVTDHRIGLTVHQLDRVLSGELEEFMDALALARQQELLGEGAM